MIHEYIEKNKTEIVNTLKELVKIPSVRSEAEEGAPFGKECARVLEYLQELYRDNGIETELDREGGYLLAHFGSGEKSLGLFAHADVVDVGNDWIYKQPFNPVEKDGCLVGRGVSDNKSAAVISLYCAKMLKELEIPFNSRLVLFTGANEETGMHDIENYLKKHTAPDFALVADTAFPFYRGDKGSLQFIAESETPLEEICDFCGGKSINITLGKASARIGGELIEKTGISCHGALPEGSLNAGYLLAQTLSERDDICENDRNRMKFVSKLLEKYYGEIFGIESSDEIFGRLTCTNGTAETADGKIKLSFDVRYGMNSDIEDIKHKIKNFFAENNWNVKFLCEKKPFLISEDNPYMKCCVKAYGEFCGVANPPLYINAGATYAGMLPCALETGTDLTWRRPQGIPNGHGGAHQPDECIGIEGMLKALELIMNILMECDKCTDCIKQENAYIPL